MATINLQTCFVLCFLFFVFQGLLTDDLLKEIMAGCVGYNGKGVPHHCSWELVNLPICQLTHQILEEEHPCHYNPHTQPLFLSADHQSKDPERQKTENREQNKFED